MGYSKEGRGHGDYQGFRPQYIRYKEMERRTRRELEHFRTGGIETFQRYIRFSAWEVLPKDLRSHIEQIKRGPSISTGVSERPERVKVVYEEVRQKIDAWAARSSKV